MDPLTLSLIVGGGLGLGNLIGSLWSSHKAGDYQKAQMDYAKKQQALTEREARRTALAKAIGAEGYQSLPKFYAPPSMPNMTGPALLTGLTGLGMSLAPGLINKYYTPASQPIQTGQGLYDDYTQDEFPEYSNYLNQTYGNY